jgi:sugar/nucleoside kinase (ribokinase family)
MVALDLQGFVRKFLIPGVPRSAVEAALAGFAEVTILKADLRETAALTGAATPDAGARALSRFGPREVVVTMGPDGSMVLAEDRIERIPAFEAAGIEDATGAGDSYLAGYVAARLEGRSPREAGLFGAAVAALKLAKPGAFAGSRGEVMEFLARQQA